MLIERLSKESGLSAGRLAYFAESASRRYFVFSIKKATGGYRQIAHPARPLKSVQRWLNSRYLGSLPVHDAAMAYRKGLNIKANAERHRQYRYTLRVDFRDFFPSFSLVHVVSFLINHKVRLQIDDNDAWFVARLACRHEALTIGAPTSPVLTNAMMYNFDEKIHDYASRNNISYTRYADDLFLSTNVPNVLSIAYEVVKSECEKFAFAELSINDKKTRFLSKKFRRQVTGLIVTPDGKISIGRSRKREVKALIHQFSIDNLAPDRLEYLKGLLSFISDVEPTFIASLTNKYGEEVFAMLHMKNRPIHTSFSVLERLDPPPNPA